MNGTLIRLRVHATALPEPLRHCSHCGTQQRFATEGRFRTNVQGRRVDLWLIYRCSRCDTTWNRTVAERMPVARYDRELRPRVEHQAATFARELAFATRSADGSRPPVAPHFELLPHCRGPGCIRIELVDPLRIRLDRVLAGAFGLSRAALEAHVAAGCIRIHGGAKPLRRPAVDGFELELATDLSAAQRCSAPPKRCCRR